MSVGSGGGTASDWGSFPLENQQKPCLNPTLPTTRHVRARAARVQNSLEFNFDRIVTASTELSSTIMGIVMFGDHDPSESM